MTLVELEAQRRAQAQALGVRYYRLSKSQAMAALVQANAPRTVRAWPFPVKAAE
jgi:hypothetical protein